MFPQKRSNATTCHVRVLLRLLLVREASSRLQRIGDFGRVVIWRG